jgi:acetyltransferase
VTPGDDPPRDDANESSPPPAPTPPAPAPTPPAPTVPATPAAPPRGLDAFFSPRGVAVVGASRTPGKVGNAVVRNLLFGGAHAVDRARGFQGVILPVNPGVDEVLGLKTVPRADAIEGPIDLAIFAIPAPEVPDAMDRAARRGVRAAIVLSAGFFEMGAEGRHLEEQLRKVANNTGMRVIGPNCTGLFSAPAQLQASFFSAAPPPGRASIVSQSGAIAQALVQHLETGGFGLRHIVSLGEKVDVDDAQLVRWLAKDPGTSVIALYLESLDDARAFYEASRLAAPSKPVIVLRGGATGAGHRAAKIHEGILAVSDTAIEGALAYPGVIRVRSLPSFLAGMRALATQPPARGRRVAVVTNAGGAGVLAADAVSIAGLDVVKLRPATVQRLAGVLPNPRTAGNPIDLLGDAKGDRFLAALEIVSRAEEVDAILLLITDQAMTDPLDVATRVADWVPSLTKPMVASFVGSASRHRGEDALERRGIPTFEFPETAVAGLRALVARGAYERRLARRRRVVTTTARKPQTHTRALRRW